jgi:stalled ribosome rescue protein Dom34
MRTPRDEVERAVTPVLTRAEAEDAHTAAERLIYAVRGDGLGVAGLERTRAALAQGQVDELLLDPAAPMDETIRNDLVRMATLTGATVEVVAGHADLLRLGGVGALLRYRSTDRVQVVAG